LDDLDKSHSSIRKSQSEEILNSPGSYDTRCIRKRLPESFVKHKYTEEEEKNFNNFANQTRLPFPKRKWSQSADNLDLSLQNNNLEENAENSIEETYQNRGSSEEIDGVERVADLLDVSEVSSRQSSLRSMTPPPVFKAPVISVTKSDSIKNEEAGENRKNRSFTGKISF
jgi:hypothetical protein